MKALFRCLALAAILSALPAWAATSYYYIPAAACRPHSDCTGVNGPCVRGSDATTGRGYISIPSEAADQSILCDVTFPNNASAADQFGTIVTFHANSTDTTKKACWRASPRFADASDKLSDLTADITVQAAYTLLQTDTAIQGAVNDSTMSAAAGLFPLTAWTDVSKTFNGSIQACSILANPFDCRGHAGLLIVQRRGSDNCSPSLTATPTLFDQVNLTYPTP